MTRFLTLPRVLQATFKPATINCAAAEAHGKVPDERAKCAQDQHRRVHDFCGTVMDLTLGKGQRRSCGSPGSACPAAPHGFVRGQGHCSYSGRADRQAGRLTKEQVHEFSNETCDLYQLKAGERRWPGRIATCP